MRISNQSRISVALKVLRKVKMRESDVCVETYSNCREQGLFLTSFVYDRNGFGNQRAVSFSENRNSDDIIVQYGVRGDFDHYGVFKNDENYKTRKKYFDCGAYDEVAKFITGWLTEKIS